MIDSDIARPRADRKPTRPRLPRYVNVFTDRHGKQRSYFRHAGIRVALHGEIGSPGWWREYTDALGGRPTARKPTPKPSVRAGSVKFLISIVRGSAEYRDFAPSTQKAYERPFTVLDELVGDQPIAKLKNEHYRKIVEAQWRESIGAGNDMLRAIRVLERHALELGLIEHVVTSGLHKRGPKSRDGHHIWTPDEIAAYRQTHLLGSVARLVFELAYATGLRRVDLSVVGRQHVSSDGTKIRFVPQKTKRRTAAVAVSEITDELRAAIDLIPSRPELTFIVGANGRPMTPNHLGWLFAGWCREAGLDPRCTLHGIRKALGSEIATAGGNAYEVGAVLGISDPKTIAVYTRGRDTDALAERAFARLNRTGTKN